MKKRVLSIMLTLAIVLSCFVGMAVPANAVGTMADLFDFPNTKGCPKGDFCPMYDFTDVDQDAWYHDGVHFCLGTGLMNGMPDNLFAPNEMTTRAQILSVLWGLEGAPLVPVAEAFNDVFDGDWYDYAIRWATANNVAEGYGDGYFGPNDAITREQIITILWRYTKLKGVDVSVGEDTNILSYEDIADVAEYAIPAMQWACGAGVVEGMKGSDGGMFLNPKNNTTRAQLATMLMRFCAEPEMLEEEEQIEPAATVRPLPDTTMENLQDAILSVAFKEGDVYVDDTGKLQMKARIYAYDKYDMVDIAMLKVGDTIVTHSGEVQVTALERGATGILYVNGGLDNGGFDLVTDDSGVFFETGYSDVKSWYQVGEATLRVSADFKGSDISDLENGEIIIYPGDFLVKDAVKYDFTPHNTTVRLAGGQVVELTRVYTP